MLLCRGRRDIRCTSLRVNTLSPLTGTSSSSVLVPQLIQTSSFHTSIVTERYGRKNRTKPKKSFFRPHWRYLHNLENLYQNEMDDNPILGKYLHRQLMVNFPLGDMYMHLRRKVTPPFSEWKEKYYEIFPDDRLKYLHRAKPEDHEWYLLPSERFIKNMRRHVDEEGMSEPDAFKLALLEKQWEEEAKAVENEIQKKQAEFLFKVPEKDWAMEYLRDSHVDDVNEDPIIDEEILREKEELLMNLIHQRMVNPQKRLIKLTDTSMTFQELMTWLSTHTEYREHLDESIYWGELPYNSLPLSLPPDMRPRNVSLKPGEETLLEDLDYMMSDWAQDMLKMFWDKVDPESIKEDQEENEEDGEEGMESKKEEKRRKAAAALEKKKAKIRGAADAASVARMEMLSDMKPWVEHGLVNRYSSGPQDAPQPYTVFADGAEEVVSRDIREKPFINADLEKELSELFRKVSPKK